MSYIKVDHSRFEVVANSCDNYANNLEYKMNASSSEVNNLLTCWEGEDSVSFCNQWESLFETNKPYPFMKNYLNSYANFLRFSAEKYKEAQIDAVNKTTSLGFL